MTRALWCAPYFRSLLPTAGFAKLRQRFGRDGNHVTAIGADVDEDVGHDETRARELDGSQCQARPDEFVATTAGIRDVIADFGMCKHGLFSATGRTTRDRVVTTQYGAQRREDSASRRYN